VLLVWNHKGSADQVPRSSTHLWSWGAILYRARKTMLSAEVGSIPDAFVVLISPRRFARLSRTNSAYSRRTSSKDALPRACQQVDCAGNVTRISIGPVRSRGICLNSAFSALWCIPGSSAASNGRMLAMLRERTPEKAWTILKIWHLTSL
jgi:hypothetical protein